MERVDKRDNRRSACIGRRVLLGVFLGVMTMCIQACKTTERSLDYDPAIPRFVLETRGEGSIVSLPVSNVRILVDPSAVITEYDLQDVSLAELEMGACLRFATTRRAARILYQASVSNQGMRMVLLVNGQPIGIQKIDRPIPDGVFHVFIELPDSDLPELARNLKGTILDIQSKLSR